MTRSEPTTPDKLDELEALLARLDRISECDRTEWSKGYPHECARDAAATIRAQADEIAAIKASEERATLAERTEIIFPRHEASLHLTHNQHKAYYETIEEAESSGTYSRSGWVSDEQRAKAIVQNSVWELQWYPDTPIGSFCLQAYDLDVLLTAANQPTGEGEG
jgi:hypothetical protein